MIPRVLAAVADPSLLERVFLALGARPYHILASADGEDAFEQFLREQPDIVIASLDLPDHGGWTLLERIRSTPHQAVVGVFVLSPSQAAQDRLEALRLGADDLVAIPFALEELDLRVSRALERLQLMRSAVKTGPRREDRVREGPGLQGSLKQISLASLLLMLEIEKKSGVLVLTSLGEVESARVFLRSGAVVSARLEGKEQPRNEEVLYSLLGWKDGRFVFRTLAVDVEAEIRVPTSALLVEGTRRLDESRRPESAS
jgi:CheY-like chemotaxis protein